MGIYIIVKVCLKNKVLNHIPNDFEYLIKTTEYDECEDSDIDHYAGQSVEETLHVIAIVTRICEATFKINIIHIIIFVIPTNKIIQYLGL